MKIIVSRSVLTVLCAALLIQCKKDEKEAVQPDPLGQQEQLLAGQSTKGWLLQQVFVNGEDITGTFAEPCRLDDNHLYNRDHSFKVDEGQTTCSVADPQTYEHGSWHFTADLKKLIVVVNRKPDTVNVDELSPGVLQTSFIESGDRYVFRFTSQ